MSVSFSGKIVVDGLLKGYIPLTVPVDPYWNNVALLVRGDGVNGSTNFSDVSPTTKTITLTGTRTVSTTVSKFGTTGSINFSTPSSDNYLNVGYHADFLDLLNNDFTIEFWIYLLGTAINCPYELARQNLGAYNGACFIRRPSSVWRIQNSGSSSTTWIDGADSQFNGAASTWHHIAFTREGNTGRQFLNGVLTGTPDTLSGSVVQRTTDGYIGRGSTSTDSSARLHGYLEELRVTAGVARYTTTFAVPTEPFPTQ